jgi:hypothetical protein
MTRRRVCNFVVLACLGVFLLDFSGLALLVHHRTAHAHERECTHAQAHTHGSAPHRPAHGWPASDDTHDHCQTCRQLIALTLDLPVAPPAVAVATTPVAAATLLPARPWTFHLPDHRCARAPPAVG